MCTSVFFNMYVFVRFVPPAARFSKNPGPRNVPASQKSTLKARNFLPYGLYAEVFGQNFGKKIPNPCKLHQVSLYEY